MEDSIKAYFSKSGGALVTVAVLFITLVVKISVLSFIVQVAGWCCILLVLLALGWYGFLLFTDPQRVLSKYKPTPLVEDLCWYVQYLIIFALLMYNGFVFLGLAYIGCIILAQILNKQVKIAKNSLS